MGDDNFFCRIVKGQLESVIVFFVYVLTAQIGKNRKNRTRTCITASSCVYFHDVIFSCEVAKWKTTQNYVTQVSLILYVPRLYITVESIALFYLSTPKFVARVYTAK